MLTILRRATATLVLVGVLAGVACGQATSPGSASPSSSASPATSAKPSASTAAPAKSAEPSASAAKPSASADWKAEWDTVVAAAKKEGAIVVGGPPGEVYRQAMVSFEKAYPEIKFDYSGFAGPNFVPKISAERTGGQYLWDIFMSGRSTAFPIIPQGFFDPLEPALIRPDVVDDSKWMGGFAAGLVDKGHKFEYQFVGMLLYGAQVNRDMVPESELSTFDQLLEPKWKGKIGMMDPRVPGSTASYLGYLNALKGDEWTRKFFAQEPVIVQDGRAEVEAVVRGKYPIVIASPSGDLAFFAQQGMMQHVKPLAPTTPEGRRLTSAFGNVLMVNKAPHPNAAKVFLNWLLSQEGQQSWATAAEQNSRRLDVKGPPETAPDPKVKYEFLEVEGSPLDQGQVRVMNMAKEVFH